MLSDSDSARTPPGSFLARVLKELWYFGIWGTMISVSDMIKDIFVKIPQINVNELEKRSEQVVVMTGGPRGIGFDIVKKCLQLDYIVILGVRNVHSSQKGIEKIRKLGVSSGRVKMFLLDLKSLRSVRHFANEVLASPEGSRIDLLVNNGGIMNTPYERTEDNFESQFQVNYLSHFLLTNLLIPRIKATALKKTQPCQIINTSSHAQRGGRLNFNELETSKVYCPIKCYFDSKLCQVIHAKTLEKMFLEEEVNIHAYSVHPGEIPTDLWSELGVIDRLLRPIMKFVCRSTDDAATTVLYPVLNSEAGQKFGGHYFQSCEVMPPNPAANDSEIQKRLWNKSLQLTELGHNQQR